MISFPSLLGLLGSLGRHAHLLGHKTAGKALCSGLPPSFLFPHMLVSPSTQRCPCALEPFPRARLNPLRTKEHLYSISARRKTHFLGSPERQQGRRQGAWLCSRAPGRAPRLAGSKTWASAWCDRILRPLETSGAQHPNAILGEMSLRAPLLWDSSGITHFNPFLLTQTSASNLGCFPLPSLTPLLIFPCDPEALCLVVHHGWWFSTVTHHRLGVPTVWLQVPALLCDLGKSTNLSEPQECSS